MSFNNLKKFCLRWPVVWLALIISNIVFAIIIFWSLPKLSELANGQKMFDVLPSGYSFSQAHSIIKSLDVKGVSFYLNTQLWIDSFYPAFFAISFILLITKFLQAYKLPKILVIILLFVPVLTAVFDYTENYYISLMLRSDIPFTAQLVSSASFFTIIKSAASAVTQTIALVLFVLFVFGKVKKST